MFVKVYANQLKLKNFGEFIYEKGIWTFTNILNKIRKLAIRASVKMLLKRQTKVKSTTK